MAIQKKNSIGILAIGAALALLTGCGEGRYGAAGAWDWTPPTMLAQNPAQPTNAAPLNTAPAVNSGTSSAVIVPPGRANAGQYAYSNPMNPEFDRRDESMSIRSNETYLSMGWPEAPRASLDNQRTFYTSDDPNRYVYPSTTPRERYHTSHGSYHNRRDVRRGDRRRLYDYDRPTRRDRREYRRDSH